MAETAKKIEAIIAAGKLTVKDLQADPDLLRAAREHLGEQHPELSVDPLEFTARMLKDVQIQAVIERENCTPQRVTETT